MCRLLSFPLNLHFLSFFFFFLSVLRRNFISLSLFTLSYFWSRELLHIPAFLTGKELFGAKLRAEQFKQRQRGQVTAATHSCPGKNRENVPETFLLTALNRKVSYVDL